MKICEVVCRKPALKLLLTLASPVKATAVKASRAVRVKKKTSESSPAEPVATVMTAATAGEPNATAMTAATTATATGMTTATTAAATTAAATPRPTRPAADWKKSLKVVSERAESVYKLMAFLLEKYPEDMLMPCSLGTPEEPLKKPMLPHKDGVFTWRKGQDKFTKVINSDGGYEVGILLKEIAVIDFDDEALMEVWEERFPVLKTAPMERTRKGGHYFFKRPMEFDEQNITDHTRCFKDGDTKLDIDLKTVTRTGTSGIIIVSPSTNKKWVRALWDTELPELDQEMIEELTTMYKAGVSAESEKSWKQAPPGPSHDFVTEMLGLYTASRWDERQRWMQMAIALQNVSGDSHKGVWHKLGSASGKYDEADAERVWNSFDVVRYNGKPLGIGSLRAWAREDDATGFAQLCARHVTKLVQDNWNQGDLGLAKIAYQELAGQVKLTELKGDYYIFDSDECLWKHLGDGTIKEKIGHAVQWALRDLHVRFSNESHAAESDEVREQIDIKCTRLQKIITYVSNNAGLSSVLALTSDKFIDREFEQQLDSIPYLLGVKNGVIDLRTGELRRRKPEDMICRALSIAYDPEVDSAWVHKMVEEAMADDPEVALFVQKLFGYGITGEVCEEIFAICKGEGRNAKGLLLQTMRDTLGELYREMNTGLIVDRKTEKMSNADAEKARLSGARLAVFNEVNPGEEANTSAIQLLSGGDGIPAAPKYKTPFTVIPRYLPLLTTNHLPQIARLITALIERFLIIPFDVTFVELEEGEVATKYRRQRDNTLKTMLRENRGAFLKWLVDGAVAWYNSKDLKKNVPLRVRECTTAYFNDQDMCV